jgi:RNA polymerase sigma-70 factor (ECF subfamily)
MLEAALITAVSPLAATFDQVVRQREVQVIRVAYRVLGNWADAEDVAQEAFIRLHRHGLTFDSDAMLGSWLYRVTVNLCLDRARAARPSVEMPDLAFPGMSAEAGLLAEEEKRQLQDAMTKLAPKERAAIVLREIEGLSTAEVAEILGSSEVTVRSQISKAIAHLREILTRRKP